MTDRQISSDASRLARPTLRSASSWWPPWAEIPAFWQKNRDVLSSACALAATTGIASVLGFGYWALAARLFSPQAVGYGSAAVSAMTLLGTIGMLGLGTVLIGELPRHSRRAGLVSAALLTSGIASLVLGLLFAAVAPQVNDRFGNITGTVTHTALFAAGVLLTGVTLVFDQATIGLKRGGLQLWRNVAFVGIKLVALPAVALVSHDRLGAGITLSWVSGMTVSLLLVAIRMLVTGTPVLPRPDWAVLRGLGRTAVSHNWLNIAIQGPRLLIPVLVTVVVSPAANGAFYAAWTLIAFLYIIPTHLSTALFAVAAADPQAITRKLRLTLRMSALVGLPAMVVLALGAHAILRMFGASYAAAGTTPLVILVLGYLPTVPKLHYIAVCRATGRIPRAALVLTLAATVELVAAAAGGIAGGLTGLSLALLLAYTAEGLLTTPTVLRAAIGHHSAGTRRGRHRRAAPRGGSASNPTMTVQPGRLVGCPHRGAPASGSGELAVIPPGMRCGEARRRRQQAGLAALMSIAAAGVAARPLHECTGQSRDQDQARRR